MYCGEMCAWHQQRFSDQPHGGASSHLAGEGATGNGDDNEELSTIDAREVGRTMLQRYIEVCVGPLKDHGWSVDKARQLLQNMP